MTTDKMTQAYKLLAEELQHLRAIGEDVAADRVESAMDYLKDAAAELSYAATE